MRDEALRDGGETGHMPVAFTGYMPFIDGLRAIAVIAVVLCHAGVPGFAGGFVGVDVFFVISGFLIIGHIRAEQARGDFSVYRFYARRTLRILPVYFAMLIAVLIAAPVFILHPQTLYDFGENFVFAPIMATNFHFLREQDYFGLGADKQLLLHTWTLAVEEQFYLLVPLVLAGFAVLSRKAGKSILPAAAVLIGVAAFTSSLFLNASDGRNFAFYLMPLRAWEFIAGGLIVPAAVSRLAGLPKWALELGAAAGILLIFSAIALVDGQSVWPGWLTLMPVAGTVIVIAFGLAAPGLVLTRALAMRLPVAVGLVSYSWYLWHWPLITLGRFTRFEDSLPLDLLSGGAGGFVLAIASYRWIERPVKQRRGDLIGSRPGRVFYLGVAATIVLALAGGGFSFLAYRHVAADFDKHFHVANPAGVNLDCRITAGNQNIPPDCFSGDYVLAIGDSHMNQLVPAMASRAQDLGVKFASIASDGCSLKWFIPSLRPEGKARYHCERLAGPLERLAASTERPAAVVISFYWAWLDKGQLDELILPYTEAGTRVLLLGPVPVFKEARDCLELARRRKMSADACGVSRALLDERFRTTVALLEAEARASGLVRLVDPFAAFCDKDLCRPSDGDTLYYGDDHHLTAEGTWHLMDIYPDDFAWLFAR
jgi:peptidoglycan/LPS O-acetylase OafA/YrhL